MVSVSRPWFLPLLDHRSAPGEGTEGAHPEGSSRSSPRIQEVFVPSARAVPSSEGEDEGII